MFSYSEGLVMCSFFGYSADWKNEMPQLSWMINDALKIQISAYETPKAIFYFDSEWDTRKSPSTSAFVELGVSLNTIFSLLM